MLDSPRIPQNYKPFARKNGQKSPKQGPKEKKAFTSCDKICFGPFSFFNNFETVKDGNNVILIKILEKLVILTLCLSEIIFNSLNYSQEQKFNAFFCHILGKDLALKWNKD